MKELLGQVAYKTLDKWDFIGIELNIEDHHLESIKTDTTNNKRRHHQIFLLWKNQASAPYTWSTIIDALRSVTVEEAHLADELEAWVQSQP